MDSTKKQLFTHIVNEVPFSSRKVTIVGAGDVGTACVCALLNQGISRDIALIDVNEAKATGEMMDFQHALPLLRSGRIQASKDFAVSAGSKVCIITAGARRTPDMKSRLHLVQKNTDIFKNIIPKLAYYSPDAIFLNITNPAEIMTYVTWKLSGFPVHRVLGVGTIVDSARFRFLISEKMNVAPSAVHAMIIGEHGDSAVPVWSEVHVGGIRLADIHPHIGKPDDPEHWGDLYKQVVGMGMNLVKHKGYTNWGVAMSAVRMCREILFNERCVEPTGTFVKGLYGIQEEVFLSVPCVVGENGVNYILNQPLTHDEQEKLRNSAKILNEVQKGIKW